MNSLIKSTLLAAALAFSGAALAHPGPHGSHGLLASVAHLLGEHGYLLMVLLAAGLVTWRHTQRH